MKVFLWVIRLGKEPKSVVCCPWLVAQTVRLRIHESPSQILEICVPA